MNKKVLTLCAGFLLAGGMLSSLSAEKLSAVADNGKYYKIVRGATYSSDATGWEEEEIFKWFLDLNAENVPGLAEQTDDYWKVVTVSEEDNTYKLVNFSGKELAVNAGENVFSFNAEVEESLGLTQLLFGTNQWVGNERKSSSDGFYKLAYQDANFTNVNGSAFDAQEETATSGDVNYKMLDKYATDFVYDLQKGDIQSIRFAYNNGNGETRTYWYWDEATQQQKEAEAYDFSTTNVFSVSYDKKTQTYSFTNVKTSKVLIADQVRSFIVKNDAHGAYLQDPTSSKFVKLTFDESATGVTAELVDTAEEATYVGFQVTSTVGVPVKALNVLEKDGFSVSIYYDKKDNCFEDEGHLASDIEGNYFKGHLTTMVWDATNKKFLSTEDDAAKTIVETNPDRFYLKNSDGEFIVAEQYEGQGSSEYQALYSFTTVKEDELKEYLIRSNGNLSVDEEYFGVFRAEVKEADFDADPTAITKVDQLTNLYVNVGTDYDWAVIGRYDFTTSKVPTLVASQGTSLYPILISLGDREIVDWTTFVQGKFFTIEKVTKDAKDNGFLVPQVLNNGKDYRFEKTYGNVLEGEWALTVEFADKKNTKAKTYVFKNRENTGITFELAAQTLYYKSGAEDTYKSLGDEYVIKAVDTDPFDGYKVLSTDKELNQTWNLAYTSDGVFGGKAYLTENHSDAKDAEYHVIGLTTNEAEALKFSVKKYDGKYEKKMNSSYKYEYHPADTIYVVSKLGYYNTKKKAYDTKLDTLKVLAYTFVNQWNEPLAYGDVNANGDQGYRSLVTYKDGDKTLKYADASLAKAHEDAKKFAMRFDGDNYNLRPVAFKYLMQTEGDIEEDWKAYQEFNNVEDLVKMYAGDASIGIMDNVELYDRTENDLFTFEQTDTEIYRRLVNNVDTISIYRNDNDKSLLYEKTMKINDTLRL